MSGDYSKFSFDPRNRYSGVLMQQGRMQLDSDWNEGVDIVKDRVRKLSLDVLGRVGVPFLVTPDAFAIAVAGPPPPLDLTIGAGRIYVDGFMAENFVPPATYLTQPFAPPQLAGFPLPPLPAAGDAVVYLDVWDREVTYIEDPDLLDDALGGADTTTRRQTVWQVRVSPVDNAACGMPVGDPPSAGQLTVRAIRPPAPDDPCILPPASGYRGLENRLYRIEIHEGGPLGTARFKWSRDNGSIVSSVRDIAVSGTQTTLTVNRIGRDQFLRFQIGDWVTVTDDHRELMGEPGVMARVDNIDESVPSIILDRALPAGGRPFGANTAEIAARHTRVQKWDTAQGDTPPDADGLLTTGAGPIPIEEGIEVEFSTDPAGGAFRPGDYWVTWARTATARIDEFTAAPPRGIIHHYAQLAAIGDLGGANDVSDCRPRHHDCACCCVINVAPPDGPAGDFNSLAAAVNALGGLPIDRAAPVLICLMQGQHPVPERINLDRPFVTIRGCGRESIVQAGRGFINLNAEYQFLEDFAVWAESIDPLITFNNSQQRMSQLWVRNFASGPIAFARFFAHNVVGEIVVEDCEIEGSGGVDLAAIELDIRRNHFRKGPVVITGTSRDVRIQDNRLEDSPTEGITLRAGFVGYIYIHRNQILSAHGSGIGTGGGEIGLGSSLDHATIAYNEIFGCVRTSAATGVYGGIVLGSAAELEVRDNLIAGNGIEAATAVCGIYVDRSNGVTIRNNHISGNGRPADATAFAGPQAGIYLANARIGIGATPAARVTENDVDAPRGHALVILGAGPMIVESNRLQCHDIIGVGAPAGFTLEELLNWIGTVVIIDDAPASWLSTSLMASGFSGAPGWSSLSISGISLPPRVSGPVQFRGNQVRLDLPAAELAVANMLIVSLNDIQFVDNQSEGLLRAGPPGGSPFVLFADLFAQGITIRQADNGLFTTPHLTFYSIRSLAQVNHCLGNQTTSCIWTAGNPALSKRRDNAVLSPRSDIDCPADPP